MKHKPKKTKHSGSTLDSLLKEEGILEEVEAVAIKRVVAWQLAQGMEDTAAASGCGLGCPDRSPSSPHERSDMREQS